VAEQSVIKLPELGGEPVLAKRTIGKVMAADAAAKSVSEVVKKAYLSVVLNEREESSESCDNEDLRVRKEYEAIKGNGLIAED